MTIQAIREKLPGYFLAMGYWLLLQGSALGAVPAFGEEAQFFSVTVREKSGVFVRDLRVNELAVEIDGKPVEVAYLGREDVQAAFAFLLENSPRTAAFGVSMPHWGRINIIDKIRWGLQDDLMFALTRRGEVLLAQFFEDLEVLQDFTNVEEDLVHALHTLQPRSAGIVLDNIPVGRIMAKGLDMVRSRPERRKVLVIFSRTVDRETYQNQTEYREMFRESPVDLFWVAFAPRFPTEQGQFEEKMTGSFVRSLARETGGYAYVAAEFRYLDELFTELRGRLLVAYTIGVRVEPSSPSREHQLSVQVARKDCQVTHRPVLVY